MTKVLNILTDTNIGGAGRIFIEYIRCIDRNRFDVTAAIPSGSALIPLVEAEGIPVIETKYGHDKSFESAAVRELCSIIRRLRPDIVHTHSSLSGKIAAFLCGVKERIYTKHCATDIEDEPGSFPKMRINGFVNNLLSTKIIAVAAAAAKNLIDSGVSPKKITVILNGVKPLPSMSDKEKADFRSSIGIGDDEFVCLISARLEVHKGHSYLIDCARIMKENPEIDTRPRFIIMGDGEERDLLERQARESGVGDIVMFTGFVSDIAPYCNIADLCLNCSWGMEATSLALCEGMSLSKPAVVTDCGGNPGVITDGVNGLVVPQKDGAALAGAITRIMGDPELYRRLSEGARARYIADFTSEVMTRRIEAVYSM